MIPKRLIFIWLGSEIPDYGKFCIENFRKVNPDFEIMVVNESDLQNPQNQDFKEYMQMMSNINKSSIYYKKIHRKWAIENLITKIGKITAISDSFRLYLLNKYGGIYLDLDTFPIRNFDNKILNWPFGFTVSHHDNSPDCFFMGFEKCCVDNGYVSIKQKLPHKIKYYDKWIYDQRENFRKNEELFLKGELKFGQKCCNPEPREYYIDHFRIQNWKKHEIHRFK